jgi:hypothetical protein
VRFRDIAGSPCVLHRIEVIPHFEYRTELLGWAPIEGGDFLVQATARLLGMAEMLTCCWFYSSRTGGSASSS